MDDDANFFLRRSDLRIGTFDEYVTWGDKPESVLREFLGDNASRYDLDVLTNGYVEMVNEEFHEARVDVTMVDQDFYSMRHRSSDDDIFKLICGVLAGVNLDRLITDYGPAAFDYTGLDPDLLLGDFIDFSENGTPEEIVESHFVGRARYEYDFVHVVRAYRRTISRGLADIPVKLIGWRFYVDRPGDRANRHRYEERVRHAIADVEVGDVVRRHGLGR